MLTATNYLAIRNLLCCLFLLLSFLGSAQTQKPGYINRTATTDAGRTVLDPNKDGYTSKTTSGFSTSDVTDSEIDFKPVPTFKKEPFGDLRRGPDHLFSDFVPDNGDNGVYTAFVNNNLLFRFRLGSVMPGSKGYSILIDTDGKFGALGHNADPDYIPATTGTNGNPGFEIEVVLETNFRIAIYNANGTSTPTLVKEYTNWQEMSQVSIAATSDNGDPDFLYDFYIPFSDLEATPFNLTTSTPLRMNATTVMSPQAAIGGPKSDIYGLNDDDFKNTNAQYEAYINAQPAFTLSNLQSGGISSLMCTAAPTVNSPISAGNVIISGTWTKADLSSSASTATITVYKNGNPVGTKANVSSGATWSLDNQISVANNDMITAKAQVTGESMCLESNSVSVTNCNSSNQPVQPTGFCGDRKGFGATNYPVGATINLYRLTSTGQTLIASGAIGVNGFAANGAGWSLSNGCSAGGGSYLGGTYMVYYSLSGCDSKPAFVCASNTQGGWNALTTTAPVVDNSTSIYPTTTTISGTAVSGSLIRIYVGDIFIASPTLSGTNWSYTFSNSLSVGQVIRVTAQIADNNATKTYYCVGEVTAIVTCYTSPAIINADYNSQITIGAPITGTSSEPTGTTIRVYLSPSTLVSTATVQSDGTWTTGAYTAVAGNYYATAQNGTCGVSVNSGMVTAVGTTMPARCGSITGPVSSSATSVSGTLVSAVAGTTVRLYLDGVSIGSVNTDGLSWAIPVNTTINNTLYSNGVLTIGIQESGKQEVLCSNTTTISCSPAPASFTVSPANRTLSTNQTTTYTIDNAEAGKFYGISESVTGESLGGSWATANGSLTIVTRAFSSTGTYNINIKATSLNGVTLCYASASNAVTMNVDAALPVHLIDFKGKRENTAVTLTWVTETEIDFSHYEVERSANGVSYAKIGEKKALNATSRISYSFLDKQPLQGISYYRLRMVDIDGTFRYSIVIALNSNGSSISLSVIRPNPFFNDLSIGITLEKSQGVKVHLVDVSGRTIKVQTFNGTKGLNEFKLSSLADLPAGIYMLVVMSGEGEIKKKLIKAGK